MISTSTKYKQQLIAGNRNYVVKVNMTLADNTPLLLTNEHLWEQGVVISNGISDEDSFQIGSAIIGSLTLILDNIKGNFNGYDFLNARLTLWLGVEGDTDLNDDQVYYRIGFYVVDDTTFNGSLITLSCLDNMTWFDVPFNQVVGITYPCMAGDLVDAICNHVGVTLGIAQFPNYTTTIPAEPDGEYNCREILSYVAQKCCCYCKINTAGQLILGWYDKTAITGLTNYDGGTFNTTTTPYSDGCTLDGGSFMSGGDNADGGTFSALQNGVWLTQNFDISVGTDDIVVTGCRVRKTSGDDTYDELWTDAILELDHPRYVLVIENNPFITKTDAAATANTIGNILAGLPIRGFSSRSLSDFSYETGDMVTIIDFRGNLYHTWITNLTFTIGNSEQFSCGVESLKKRNETRFSESAKTLAEADENANAMLSTYDNAQAAMNELAQNALSYKVYEYDVSGGHVTWLYSGTTVDHTDPEVPLFPDSNNVIKITGDGVFISHDHGATYTIGLDSNSGTAILNLIYAHGITADWVRTGTLTLGGYDNISGVCSVFDAGNPTAIPPVDPQEVVRLDKEGLTTYKGSIDGTLTMGANGKITFEAASGSTRDSFTAERGGFSVKHTISSGKHAAIAFGTKAADYASESGVSWTGREFVYFNGSSSATDGGICCATGNPDNADLGKISVLRQNALLFYKNLYGDLYYSYGQSGPEPGSDKRIKKEIKELPKTKVRKFFDSLKAVSFKYKGSEAKRFGAIAQNVEEALKTAELENDAFVGELPNGYKSVRYLEFIGLQNAAIKDLYERVNTLEKELAELKARKE